MTLGRSVSGWLAAVTTETNSYALRKGVAGVPMRRKSWVLAPSRPGMIFFPSTPSTLIATPRTSGFESGPRTGPPFEKRTYAAYLAGAAKRPWRAVSGKSGSTSSSASTPACPFACSARPGRVPAATFRWIARSRSANSRSCASSPGAIVSFQSVAGVMGARVPRAGGAGVSRTSAGAASVADDEEVPGVLRIDLSVGAEGGRRVRAADGGLLQDLVRDRAALRDRVEPAVLAVDVDGPARVDRRRVHAPLERMGMVGDARDGAAGVPRAALLVGRLALPLRLQGRRELRDEVGLGVVGRARIAIRRAIRLARAVRPHAAVVVVLGHERIGPVVG